MTFDHFDIVLQPFQNVINAHKICSLPLQNKQTSSKISTEMYFEILYLIVLYRQTAKFILMKLLLSIVFSDLSYEIDFLFGCKMNNRIFKVLKTKFTTSRQYQII